jgi:hypothetical protein
MDDHRTEQDPAGSDRFKRIVREQRSRDENKRRAMIGAAGVRAGTADYWANAGDEATNLTDAIANIIHYCDTLGTDFDEVLRRARLHYDAEVEEVRVASQAVVRGDHDAGNEARD